MVEALHNPQGASPHLASSLKLLLTQRMKGSVGVLPVRFTLDRLRNHTLPGIESAIRIDRNPSSNLKFVPTRVLKAQSASLEF